RAAPREVRAEWTSATASLPAALLLHRFLIPQPQPITVQIAQLCAVAPKYLHRRMNKGHTGVGQRVVCRLDIVALDRERDARAICDFPFVKENRQVGIVAHCCRFAVRDFELYLEAQMRFVPIT